MTYIMLSFVAQLGSAEAPAQARLRANKDFRDRRRMSYLVARGSRTNYESLEAPHSLRQTMCDRFDKRRLCGSHADCAKDGRLARNRPGLLGIFPDYSSGCS